VSAYAGLMRHLAAKLLVLFAVLLMPLGMAPVQASAEHGTAAAASMRHCPEQGSKHGTSGAFAECTMACSAALPAQDRVQPEPAAFPQSRIAPATVVILDGLDTDIATPPPKRA
jgi:hypothetical protein